MSDDTNAERDSEHPLGDGLKFDKSLTAEELRETARRKVSTRFLESSEPKLAHVSFVFVDEQGVRREWTGSHEDYDSDEYRDDSEGDD